MNLPDTSHRGLIGKCFIKLTSVLNFIHCQSRVQENGAKVR
jgi:hypothetical protein